MTSIIGPPRIFQMVERMGDTLEVSAEDALDALDGSAMHAIMQWSADTLDPAEVIIERRWWADVLGWKISGQSDLIWVKQKLLQDYKRCNKSVHIYGVKEEWEQQLNVYRWMAHLQGVEIDKLQIVAWYKGWSKTEQRREKGYPPSAIEILNVPVWPLKQAEEYVYERVRVHQEASVLATPDLPLCTEEERWQNKQRFAVMIKGNKKASAVFDTRQEALFYIGNKMAPDSVKNAYIEPRLSEPRRCQDWCPVRFHCEFGKKWARV